MRTSQIIGIGLVVAGLVPGALGAQEAQDADRKVAGGGVTVPGWKGKEDAGNKQGLTVKDSKLAPEGKGMRLVTGPAGLYWSDKNVAKGDYSVKATFTEPKQSFSHPHPYGVFIGGESLDGGAGNALYCVAYRNGNYIIRGFNAGKRFDIVPKPVPNDAVKKAAGPEAEVVQEVGWNVKGDSVECVINGTSVWKGTKADVTGPGKLTSTDGIAGIRVSHNSDAIVTNFAISK